MIINFEIETAPLTEGEKKVAVNLSANFKYYIGKENAITGEKIIEHYNKTMPKDFGYAKMSGPRLRKVINYIRLNGMVTNLIATSKGYYVSEDKAEIATYVKSLTQRAEAINKIASTYKY